MVAETTRSLDEGGPFLLHAPAHEPDGPQCGHGVLVETRFEPRADTASDTITLLLRRAERGEGVAVRAYGEPVMATLSLATGRCVPVDEDAARLVREHAWLGDALVERLDWLRDRARRAIAQYDRETSIQAALHGAEPGSMTPYDKLFPADWDLLIQQDGIPYWAVDQHCLKPTCSCAQVVVELHRIDSLIVRRVGLVKLDLRDPQARPNASTPLAGRLFEKLWARRRDELVRRHEEVRRQVLHVAHGRAVVAPSPTLPTPARNAPCPCGSGKKYKRCCAPRDAGAMNVRPAPRAKG